MTDNKQQLAVQPAAQTTSVNFFDPNQFAVVQRMSNLFASWHSCPTPTKWQRWARSRL